ncbi:hypothetical protein EAS64_26150 [Trebonia kvetii]|uniref:Uncharacterized protein n=1 Tax=Trebonia kvetii TaxID=2480626 RepID=A0A6P2BTJ4_9ACTN|nr:hypothetical protein [Trebonia kvetii]TVZ02300.1 hypothetical protein EAS64_26150 [Trebonia kvetii]
MKKPKRTPGEWNGVDYYVMFGDDLRRSWEDARTWGYVAAGGGRRWSRPLEVLQPGARVFVHHPPRSYVGVGRVLRDVLPITDFRTAATLAARPCGKLRWGPERLHCGQVPPDDVTC